LALARQLQNEEQENTLAQVRNAIGMDGVTAAAAAESEAGAAAAAAEAATEAARLEAEAEPTRQALEQKEADLALARQLQNEEIEAPVQIHDLEHHRAQHTSKVPKVSATTFEGASDPPKKGTPPNVLLKQEYSKITGVAVPQGCAYPYTLHGVRHIHSTPCLQFQTCRGEDSELLSPECPASWHTPPNKRLLKAYEWQADEWKDDCLEIEEEETLRDGRKVTVYSDGTYVENHPDGTEFTMCANGVVVTESPQHGIVERHGNGRIVRLLKDGTYVEEHSDGVKVTLRVDGVQVIEMNNGTVIEKHPDGRQVRMGADGSYTEQSDGVRVTLIKNQPVLAQRVVH